MSTNVVYVRLLDEGVEVSRPTQAQLIERDEYRLLPSPNYDPEVETWEFPPGSIVRCQLVTRGEKQILLAVEAIQ